MTKGQDGNAIHTGENFMSRRALVAAASLAAVALTPIAAGAGLAGRSPPGHAVSAGSAGVAVYYNTNELGLGRELGCGRNAGCGHVSARPFDPNFVIRGRDDARQTGHRQ